MEFNSKLKFANFLRAMRCIKFQLVVFFENSDQINFCFWTWKSTKNYIVAQFGLTLDEKSLWIFFVNTPKGPLVEQTDQV